MKKYTVFFFVGLVSGFMSLFVSVAFSGEEILIAHPKLPQSSVTQPEIKKIFLGKMAHWNNGKRIVLVVQKQGKTHKDFLSGYVGKTVVGFRNYWRKKVFTGTGSPPETLKSDEDVVQFVSSQPGAVGYISSNSAHSEVMSMQIFR